MNKGGWTTGGRALGGRRRRAGGRALRERLDCLRGCDDGHRPSRALGGRGSGTGCDTSSEAWAWGGMREKWPLMNMRGGKTRRGTLGFGSAEEARGSTGVSRGYPNARGGQGPQCTQARVR
eukprot:scaffold146099_cov39-Tisochrysis_lutea.AAC.1